jgi:hypothetical protein
VGDGAQINDSAFTASAPATIGAGATAELFQHTGSGRLEIGANAQAGSSTHAGSGLTRIRGQAVGTQTSSYAGGSVFVEKGGKLNGCTVSSPSDTVVMPGADIENSRIIAGLNIFLSGASANGATISEPYNGSEREESMISVFNQGLRGAVSVGSAIFPGPVPDQPGTYTVQGSTTASDIQQALQMDYSCLPEQRQRAIKDRLLTLLDAASEGEQKRGRPAAVEDGTDDEES